MSEQKLKNYKELKEIIITECQKKGIPFIQCSELIYRIFLEILLLLECDSLHFEKLIECMKKDFVEMFESYHSKEEK